MGLSHTTMRTNGIDTVNMIGDYKIYIKAGVIILG